MEVGHSSIPGLSQPASWSISFTHPRGWAALEIPLHCRSFAHQHFGLFYVVLFRILNFKIHLGKQSLSPSPNPLWGKNHIN